MRGVNDVRQQSAVHTAEPPVSELTGPEVGMASENRKSYKPPVLFMLQQKWFGQKVEGYILKCTD